MDDIPCLAIGLPPCCKAPAVFCPMARCKSKPLPTTSTIRLETHTVVGKDRSAKGMIQFQYRGNFPSAYTHDQTKPLNAAVASGDSQIGLLASTVIVGKAFGLGSAEAPFYDLPPRPAGRSPDFTGWVHCHMWSQIEDLKSKLREDCIVTDACELGDTISGVQVKGWVLTDIGFMKTGTELCGRQQGGEIFEPRPVKSKEEAEAIIKIADEKHIGELGMNFQMRFRLPDLEKQVVTEGVDSGFNALGQGFKKGMLEEVSCACVCMRVWMFPCNLTHKDKDICRIPLYAREFETPISAASSDLPQIPVVLSSGVLAQMQGK